MSIFKQQKSRRIAFSIISAFVVAVFLLIGIGSLQLYRNSLVFGDMTTEKLYTMTDDMVEELKGIPEGVKITFCADPDVLLAHDKLSYVYILARQLEKKNKKISVETVSLSRDTHALDAYKSTSATTYDYTNVIVSYGNKYRTADAESFYTKDDAGKYWSFKGEYQLASMILSVTNVLTPCAYFTTGHGEHVYDVNQPNSDESLALEAFYYLLTDAGMRVETINLDELGENQIPDDCVLLIMNAPTMDYDNGDSSSFYGESSLEKVDKYLEKKGNLLYFKNEEVPTENLPRIYQYLAEWGFAFHDDILKESKNDLLEEERKNLKVVYASEESSDVAHSVYSTISDLATAPRTIVSNTCSLENLWKDIKEKTINEKTTRIAAPLFFSSSTTRAYNADGELVSNTGSYTLGMVCITAFFAETGTYSYSYLSAFGSPSVISNQYLNSNSYGNKDVMYSLLRVMTRTDTYASSELGSSTDLNAKNYGGKIYDSDDIVEATTYIYEHEGEKYVSTTKFNVKNGFKMIRTLNPMTEGAKVRLTITLVVLPILITAGAAFVVLQRRKHQ